MTEQRLASAYHEVAVVCAGSMASSATVREHSHPKAALRGGDSPGGRARAQLAPAAELLTLLALLDRLCAMLTWLAPMGEPVEAGQRERSRWPERPGSAHVPIPRNANYR